MNKFVLIALFAVLAAAHATEPEEDLDTGFSEGAPMFSNENEVKYLPNDQKPLEQFCLDSRDMILEAIKTFSDDTSSKVFSAIFFKVDDLGKTALDTMHDGANRLSGQMLDRKADIAPASGATAEAIVETQKRIAAGASQPGALLDSFKSVLSSVSSAVGNKVSQSLESLKTTFSLDQLDKKLVQFCDAINLFDEQLKKHFDEAKKELDSVKNLSYDKLKCATSSRVSQIGVACRMMSAVRTHLVL